MRFGLRNRERVDYGLLHRAGRRGVDALAERKPLFDRNGLWHYDRTHEPRPPSDDNMRQLTDQTAVLQRRDAASEQNAQRFIHSRRT